jgi:hypothetical protein
MANIDTLIQDIYKTLEKGINTGSVQNRDAIQKCTSAMYDSIRRTLEEGQRETSSNLRMSQIGKPTRQIWYDLKETKKPDLDGQTKLKFLFGDMLESLLILLATVSGHEVTEEQKEVEVNGIKGHKDCRIDGVLVDVKSASSYAFKKFKDGTLSLDDPFGYIAQISGYAEAGKDKEAAFFAIDKSSAELALLKVGDMDMINASDRINELKEVASKDTPPPRCYGDVEDGKSGNRKLVIGCVFCPYKETCWADANGGQGLRAFKYSNGVRYLTVTAKIPDVEEITAT